MTHGPEAPHDGFRSEVAAAFEEVERLETADHGGQPLANAGIEGTFDRQEWIGHSCHESLSRKSHRGSPCYDMDSPCSYGIGCARLKTVDRSITEQGESR